MCFIDVRVDKRMYLIMETFFNARMALLSILIVLLVFLTGFALAFTLGFGDRVDGFRSFPYSFMTLTLAIFGEFPHEQDLQRANGVLGPLLLLLFQCFVNFCLVSLFIAIVEDAFTTAQDNLDKEEGEKDLLIRGMRNQARRLQSLVWRRSSGIFGRRHSPQGRAAAAAALNTDSRQSIELPSVSGGAAHQSPSATSPASSSPSPSKPSHQRRRSNGFGSRRLSGRVSAGTLSGLLAETDERRQSEMAGVNRRIAGLERKLDLVLSKLTRYKQGGRL